MRYPDAIAAPDVAALRERIEIVTDGRFGRDSAAVEIELATGDLRRAHIANARGSAARPMTALELDAKFEAQARTVLGDSRVRPILGRLHALDRSDDVAAWLRDALG